MANLSPWLLGRVWVWTRNEITLLLALEVICHNQSVHTSSSRTSTLFPVRRAGQMFPSPRKKKKNQVKALRERNCTVLLQLISVNQIRVTSLTEMYTGLWSSWEPARWSCSPSCCNVVKLVEKLAVLISFLPVDAATTSTCVCTDMGR